jgi:lycopene beta-cyclase
MLEFDDIILGAGASGLSLAYHMALAGLQRRVLIVERAPKLENDRTWSFWEATPGVFEPVVSQRWDHIWVHGDGLSKRFAMSPYVYKMIRGIDFYEFMFDWLEKQSNITLVYGELESLEDHANGVRVQVNGETYSGQWAFNSVPASSPIQILSAGNNFLMQHFKGWIIETPEPVFDPLAATFMDFRVQQTNDTRFVYVLPQSTTRALVEYTIFSGAMLPEAEYDAALKTYIREVLKVSSYQILETEYNMIPMTDAPFQINPSKHVTNIGTAGGRTKASTGYTFRRIQQQSALITSSLVAHDHPRYPTSSFDWYGWMDSVFLNVLAHNRQPGAELFTDFFKRNPVLRVMDFLNESSSLPADLALMTTMNMPVFIRSALEIVAADIRNSIRKRKADSSRSKFDVLSAKVKSDKDKSEVDRILL